MEEQEIEGAKNNDRLNLPREKAARSMQFLRTEFLSRFRAMIPRNGSVTKGLAAEVERKAGKLFPHPSAFVSGTATLPGHGMKFNSIPERDSLLFKHHPQTAHGHLGSFHRRKIKRE